MALGSVDGVAAAFTVIDEFSGPLAAAEEQISGLQASLERLSGVTASAFGGFGEAANRIARAAASMDRMATLRTRTEAVASADAAATLAKMGAAIPSAGGGGGRRGGGWGGVSEGAAAGSFGRKLVHAPTLPERAGAFIGDEAFKSALETNYHVTAGVELFDPNALKNVTVRTADVGILTSLAQQSAIGTIYTTEQTAQAYDMPAAILATAPAFQGTNKWQNFSSVAPIILRASEVAAMRGLGSLQGNMLAMAWYAHLTGADDAASMQKRSDQFLAIAERTGVEMPRLERAINYAVPIARGTGIDMPQTALLTAELMQAGHGTRAGYAVGQLVSGLLQRGGPITAALQGKIRDVGGELYTGKRLNVHLSALHALGLTDAHGQLTVLNAKGNVDLAKVTAGLEAAGRKLNSVAFANAMHAAFGLRGMRGGDLLSVMKASLPAFVKPLNETPGAAAQQAAFAQTPLQQFEQLWAWLQDIGRVLADALLPDLNNLLGVLLKLFDLIDDALRRWHMLAAMGGGAGVGAAVGFTVGGPAGAGVGAAVGAAVGVVTNIPEGKPTPKGMPGERLSREALLGIHFPPQQITVNAHQTVTINSTASEEQVREALREASQDMGDFIASRIATQQRDARRRSLQDSGDASTVNLGPVLMGGL